MKKKATAGAAKQTARKAATTQAAPKKAASKTAAAKAAPAKKPAAARPAKAASTGGAKASAARAGSRGRLVPVTDGSRAAEIRLAVLDARGRGPADVEPAVRRILEGVQQGGDAAVSRFTKQFDSVAVAPGRFEVTADEIAEARKRVPRKLMAALREAHERIQAFHEKQRERGFEKKEGGITTGIQLSPLARVGVYVPGGKASYPSSVLMNIVPAAVAGVEEITVVTPPSRNGIADAVLAAASLAGATRVLRIGGAQAIAALAYGTERIDRVDKIVGPGNIYVATAKRLVFGEVDIDMVAGPSEVLILADETADPEWVAADMLAQAEHDELAAAVCITTSQGTAAAIAAAVQRQCAELARGDIAAASIRRYGTILVVNSLERACAVANEIAPEHLEVVTKSPRKLLPKLRNAGAIFLGPLTTEAIGDYAAGPNHVLPTGGAARYSSPLGVYDFVKRTSIIEVDRRGFDRLAPTVVELATAEGLEAHALAVTRRAQKKSGG